MDDKKLTDLTIRDVCKILIWIGLGIATGLGGLILWGYLAG